MAPEGLASGRPARAAFRSPILAGLLFVVMLVVAGILWMPIAACPVCGGQRRVTGPSQLTFEESVQPDGKLFVRRVRKEMPTFCPECEHGRISVLRKWTLRP